ncbi:hypothetical protein [uncultured Aquimarina sp.]|uniref:hypothetical protein n=1 Tax=uncultured Aquimarina sp. TaxID=575652 RepID=UPI00260B77A1|nr:hypothetical protein [uncultured Aquimarina sp.]
MKKIIFVILLTITKISFSQNCNELNGSESDFCWVKTFLINSPIIDKLDNKFLNYNYGVNNYYPKGSYVPWGGYYMPLLNGGIATRWQISDTYHPKSNSLLTWDEVKKMSQDEISKLSPSEKMDIYMGNKDFAITKNELTRRGPERSNVESWEGFCNGIRLAGAMLPEPKHSVTVKSKSPDNIFIRFDKADLKALGGAVYYYTEYYASLGENNKRKPDAGQFDILLRYMLGYNKRPFFMDIKKGEEKWNETIVGYERKIIKEENHQENTNKTITIRTVLYLLGEIGFDEMNSYTSTEIENKKYVGKWVYNYTLEVNGNDEIIEGDWKKDSETTNLFSAYFPDYVWFGGGKGLDELYLENRYDNNPLLPFFEVQNLFFLSIK